MSNPPDWNMLKVVLDLAQWVVAIGVGVYAWWIGRNRDAANQLSQLKAEREKADADLRQRHDELEKEIRGEIRELERAAGRAEGKNNALRKELEAMQQRVSSLPGHPDLAAVSSKLENVDGSLKALEKSVSLITEHLMGSRGKP